MKYKTRPKGPPFTKSEMKEMRDKGERVSLLAQKIIERNPPDLYN